MLDRVRRRAAAEAAAGDTGFELEHERIIQTARRLRQRIDARFPGRGIGGLVRRLESLAERTMGRLASSTSPK